MKEEAVVFGKNGSLVGVIADPRSTSGAASLPAIIVLNAGMVHRVGPNRLSVKIARKLSSVGFVVLRFDYSGIGDSEPRRDGLPFEKSAVSETREAMDLLAAVRGADRFVLIGLCSGADNAFSAARDDPRVVGAVLIDGFAAAFPVGGYLLRLYAKNTFSYTSWRRLLAGRSLVWTRLKAFLTFDAGRDGADGSQSPEEGIVEGFRALIHRGVRLLLVYSADTPAYRNYRLRMEKTLQPFSCEGKLRVETFLDSDHVFSLLSHQERLIGTICVWLQNLRPSEELGIRP